MNITARLRKLESSMGSGDGEVKIKVSHHHSHDEWSTLKNLFNAKRVLGLLTPRQIRRTIFVGRKMAGDEEPMTREEARAILNNQGVTA